MLKDKAVLIIEDNVGLAVDLAAAVEQLNGRVIGPVGKAADALALLDSEQVAAAILDYELPDSDMGPVAKLLAIRGVPFVIHTDGLVPPEIALLRPGAPILMKPIEARDVIVILAHELIKAEKKP